MLTRCNNGRCVGASGVRSLSLAAGLGVVLGLAVLAPSGVLARQEALPATREVRSPDEAEAMAAFQAVSEWARAGRVDERDIGPAVRLASVVIRLDGRIVGKGWAEGERGVVQTAAKRAITAAESALPRGKDLIAEENGRSPWRERVSTSVELVGVYVPFTPKTYDQVDRELAPGLDGVAVRIGENFEAVFPEAMLAARLTPGDALAAAVARAADDPAAGLRVDPKGQPADVARERGATFYRFRPFQVAEINGAARFLYRGGEIFRESELTSPVLHDYARSLASYLLKQRLRPEDRGEAEVDEGLSFRGAVLPGQGRCETPLAGEAEQLACAWALLRFESLGTSDTHSGEGTATSLLSSMARPTASSGEPRFLASIGATAMWGVLAAEAGYVFEEPRDGTRAVRREWQQCRDRLVSLSDNLQEIPAGQRGLVVCALARMAHAEESDVIREGARLATLKALELTPPSAMPAEMPWLGWAAIACEPEGEAIGPAPALREFRDLCYAHQLSPTSPGAERRDMGGGIMLAGNTEYPTWATTRPVAFVCTMLGEPRLTSADERAKEIGRLIPALRYLRQLAADDSIARLHAEPARTAWGVRAAMWDLRQPPEATALTLVAVCEAIRSLETVSARAK